MELQRDLSLAISEYAPGSQVIANGERFTGRYIRKVPSIGWKMYDYVYCEACGTLNIDVYTGTAETSSLSQCHVCGAPIELSKVKTFIVPSFGFEIDPDDIRKPGLSRPERTYRTDVSFVGYRNDIQMKQVKVGLTFAMASFSEKDEMAVLNRSDFHICETCGYGVPDNTFLSFSIKEHKMPSGHICRNRKLRRFSLGYRFETDVFMLHFPEYPISYETEEAVAYSVLYALIRGIIRTLDLEDSDISGCLQCISTTAGTGYCFVFYDTTPGGAGHMRRLQDQQLLLRAIRHAYDLVSSCSCGGEEGHASCYACLRSYDNQKYHDLLERSLAIQYLKQIL